MSEHTTPGTPAAALAAFTLPDLPLPPAQGVPPAPAYETPMALTLADYRERVRSVLATALDASTWTDALIDACLLYTSRCV